MTNEQKWYVGEQAVFTTSRSIRPDLRIDRGSEFSTADIVIYAPSGVYLIDVKTSRDDNASISITQSTDTSHDMIEHDGHAKVIYVHWPSLRFVFRSDIDYEYRQWLPIKGYFAVKELQGENFTEWLRTLT